MHKWQLSFVNTVKLILPLLICFNILASEAPSPVRAFITDLAKQSGENVFKSLQKELKTNTSKNWPRKLSIDETILIDRIKTELNKQNAKIYYSKEVFIVEVASLSITVKMVDFLSQTFEINGTPYSFAGPGSLDVHIDNISRMLTKKTVVTPSLVEEAHALIPLILLVPAVIGASGAALTADYFMSTAVNSMKNMGPEAQEKIKSLTDKYTKRAEACESDFGSAKANNNNKQYIEGLSSVRAIGELHKVLNAELYEVWLNGKSRINYKDFGCEEIVREQGLSIGSVSGVFRSEGTLLAPLCKAQDRLTACLKDTEELMRDNDIKINDLSGPDRFNPLGEVPEDFKRVNTQSK